MREAVFTAGHDAGLIRTAVNVRVAHVLCTGARLSAIFHLYFKYMIHLAPSLQGGAGHDAGFAVSGTGIWQMPLLLVVSALALPLTTS